MNCKNLQKLKPVSVSKLLYFRNTVISLNYNFYGNNGVTGFSILASGFGTRNHRNRPAKQL